MKMNLVNWKKAARTSPK